jgi:hypothetical protein
LTIKLTPYTEFVSHLLADNVSVTCSCLDAIASAPLPSLFPRKAGELVASTLICAFQCNARQIFNCQRSLDCETNRIPFSDTFASQKNS